MYRTGKPYSSDIYILNILLMTAGVDYESLILLPLIDDQYAFQCVLFCE